DTLAFQIAPVDGPSDESTVELVHQLLDNAEALGAEHGVEVGYTGATVANIDISDQLADALPIYLLIVVGLSLVLLLLVFRSLWVPLLASLGFLISVAAAFGGVVGVYQLGYLAGVFDVHEAGPILSFLPIALIGVLFGLAMDYQVFLGSGMREAYVHGTPARTAVVTGFNQSARVVTAAAIIMVSVFAGFIFAELTMVRPIGFGLALGILVDAFLVRMTFIPAVLSLLGDKAWWLPRWLDRILPNVDVEGAKLERQLERKEPAGA
ncbi:MAG TPA: MMPL family transporter, partial [Actinomycetaceae bacterium]|nr:MMPL family transporter [Actinomycetaceae bacterium]